MLGPKSKTSQTRSTSAARTKRSNEKDVVVRKSKKQGKLNLPRKVTKKKEKQLEEEVEKEPELVDWGDSDSDSNVENVDPVFVQPTPLEKEKGHEEEVERPRQGTSKKNREKLKTSPKKKKQLSEEATLKRARLFHVLKQELLAPFMAQLLIRHRFNELLNNVEDEETIVSFNEGNESSAHRNTGGKGSNQRRQAPLPENIKKKAAKQKSNKKNPLPNEESDNERSDQEDWRSQLLFSESASEEEES